MIRGRRQEFEKKSLTIPLRSSILNKLSGQGPDAAGTLSCKGLFYADRGDLSFEKNQINP